MLREHSPDVSVENGEARIPSGSAYEIDVTSVLLETWCNHELLWVVHETNAKQASSALAF